MSTSGLLDYDQFELETQRKELQELEDEVNDIKQAKALLDPITEQ